MMDNDYLQHYGVKGMKWGVRRAIRKTSQNERYKQELSKLSGPNKYGIRAEKFKYRADKLERKAGTNASEKDVRKIQKLRYKAEKQRSYSSLNNLKIAKVKYKISKNEYYNKKVTDALRSLSPDSEMRAQEHVKKLLGE